MELNSLEASVEVSRGPRHDGFDEERLLAVALLVTPDDTEAPALVVGLLQDDVPAPVHGTETTRAELEFTFTPKKEHNMFVPHKKSSLYLGNPSQRVHSGVQLRASSRGSSIVSMSPLFASLSSSGFSERVWMTRRATWD